MSPSTGAWLLRSPRYRTACFFLAANCLFENVGVWTHEINLAAGVMLLLFLVLLSLRNQAQRPSTAAVVTATLMMLAGTALLRGDLMLRGAGLGLIMAGLMALRSDDARASDLLPLALAAIAYGIYRGLCLALPILWYTLRSVTAGLSAAVALITTHPISVGPSFAGVHITMLVWIMLASVPLYQTERRWWRALGYAAGAGAANVAYLALFAFFPVAAPDAIRGRYPLFLLPCLILFDLPLLLLYFRTEFEGSRVEESARAPASPSTVAPFFSLLAVCSLAVGLAITLWMRPIGPARPGAVVFYEKGYLNWLTPSFSDFGAGSAGMFGNLPRFLEALGSSTRRVTRLDEAALNGASVLAMINIEEAVPDAELQQIWRFVERGGSLLVLGDHTFVNHGKLWLNEILAPAAIRFNFDSANFFVGGWLHSFEFFRHAVTQDTGDRFNDPGIVVGASLSIAPPAIPLVIGKYGYSDPGNLKAAKQGYLGNLEYDPGEPLGDVVLAAVQPYGAGQVMVFGDTSGFANPILVGSYAFVERVFTWLQAVHPWQPARLVVPLAAGACFGLALFVLRRRTPALPTVVGLCAATAAVAIAANVFASHGAAPRWHDRIAYVDTSHFERFSLDGWRDEGSMGLFLNLMRNGYLAFAMNRFDAEALRDASLLVLLAPRQPLSRHETTAVRDFVANGGQLLVSVGYEEREAVAPLLDGFGFRIDNLPLGTLSEVPVAGSTETPTFYEAWPVRCAGEGCEPVVEYVGYPLIVSRAVGKGRVTVIGDTSFLLNRNLEHENSEHESHPHMKSITFLRWLLGKLGSDAPQPG